MAKLQKQQLFFLFVILLLLSAVNATGTTTATADTTSPAPVVVPQQQQQHLRVYESFYREEKEESGRHIGQLFLARFLDVLQIELRLGDGEAAQRIDDETQVKMAASDATGAPIQRSPRQTITDDNDLPTNENRPPRYSPHAGFMFYSFPFLSFTLPFGGHLKLFGQDLI